MFGKNPIRKIAHDTAGELQVHSMFMTIQGEGPHAGRPAVFVRLWGCSLACSWCDTEFENVAIPFAAEKLVEAVRALWPVARASATPSRPLCVITGGEPMRQDLAPFVQELLRSGFAVQVETAGIHCGPGMKELMLNHPGFSVVCSPKTAKLHPDIAAHAGFFKYIVDADEPKGEDGLPKYAVSQHGAMNKNLLFRPSPVFGQVIYVQPLDLPEDPARTLRNRNYCAELAIERGYRLSLQQHKILELP